MYWSAASKVARLICLTHLDLNRLRLLQCASHPLYDSTPSPQGSSARCSLKASSTCSRGHLDPVQEDGVGDARAVGNLAADADGHVGPDLAVLADRGRGVHDVIPHEAVPLC